MSNVPVCDLRGVGYVCVLLEANSESNAIDLAFIDGDGCILLKLLLDRSQWESMQHEFETVGEMIALR